MQNKFISSFISLDLADLALQLKKKTQIQKLRQWEYQKKRGWKSKAAKWQQSTACDVSVCEQQLNRISCFCTLCWIAKVKQLTLDVQNVLIPKKKSFFSSHKHLCLIWEGHTSQKHLQGDESPFHGQSSPAPLLWLQDPPGDVIPPARLGKNEARNTSKRKWEAPDVLSLGWREAAACLSTSTLLSMVSNNQISVVFTPNKAPPGYDSACGQMWGPRCCQTVGPGSFSAIGVPELELKNTNINHTWVQEWILMAFKSTCLSGEGVETDHTCSRHSGLPSCPTGHTSNLCLLFRALNRLNATVYAQTHSHP